MPTESRYVDFRAVKAAVTIEQLLSHYGILDRFKRGRDSLTGPCPIHLGTNPTHFRVSVSKNCWNCFGECQGGGNVLDLVARKENVEPMAAANLLVDWFQLDRTVLNGADRRSPAQNARANYFSTKSTAPTAVAEMATPPAPQRKLASPPKEESGINKPLRFKLELDPTHPYLAERGLTPETVAEFGLGYCEKGVMAGRIAIPIHNEHGELVGYAGRWPGIPPDGRPIYRFPDTFKKSLEIFRLAASLNAPADQPLVVVWGFFDVFKLWQIGVRKCVALMGDSLSAAQEELLTRILPPHARIAVLFPETDAGRTGRFAMLERLAQREFVRVVAFGKEAFRPQDLTEDEARILGVI